MKLLYFLFLLAIFSVSIAKAQRRTFPRRDSGHGLMGGKIGMAIKNPIKGPAAKNKSKG